MTGLRRAGMSALLLALAACSPERPPAQAYIVIPARDDSVGWAIVDRLGRELPAQDRMRIGAPTVLSEASSTMVVPFVGDCVTNRMLVERVDAIAKKSATTGSRCSANFPV